MQDDEQQESTAHPPSISSGERGSAAAAPPTEAASPAAAVAGGPGAQAEGSGEGSAEGSKTKETAQQTFRRLSKLRDKQHADYWKWLEPVIVSESVDKQEVQVCKLKCTRGGCCGKLLGTANPSRHWSAPRKLHI
jgi:hypothetical protein